MKLKNILPDEKTRIEYRTYYEGQDILTGICFWNGKELESWDGDTYNLEDEISDYEYLTPGELTVWYESKWLIE